MLINNKVFSAFFLAFLTGAYAETHTVHFDNHCGFGTPTLIQGSNVLSTGEDYTSNGPLLSAIAYLQTGISCGFNGEGCTLIEVNLANPTSPGNGSSAGIVLIPPYGFSVASGLGYYGGADLSHLYKPQDDIFVLTLHFWGIKCTCRRRGQ